MGTGATARLRRGKGGVARCGVDGADRADGAEANTVGGDDERDDEGELAEPETDDVGEEEVRGKYGSMSRWQTLPSVPMR